MASNRLKNYAASLEEEMSVDMSPMIDMVFLLLIFFLVNANMIVVKMDKTVEVPVAKSSDKQEDKNGRIVVNVYEDGTMKDANAKIVFDTESDLSAYINREREKAEEFGHSPVLHLRGDRRAVFRYSKRVIKAASVVGVDQIKFATYAVNKY